MASIRSRFLQKARLPAGSEEASAERTVAAQNATTGASNGQHCARRTSGSRSRQSHRRASAARADCARVIDSPSPTAKPANTARRSASTSVGVPLEDDARDRQADDLEVEPERPVLDVLEVV